jgi:hypothetical protein
MLADAGSTGSVGLWAESFSGVGVNALGGFDDTNTSTFQPALSVVGTAGDLIDACTISSAPGNECDGLNYVFQVDKFGDVFAFNQVSAFTLHASTNADVDGEYLKNGTCVAGCTAATATSPGREVASYSDQVTTPTIEDFGEAQLSNGQSYVPLDPRFANIIERRTNYLVFITPEGPNRGLYVTQKTPEGFSVRENPGGQSTLAFSYRIVAKRYGESLSRLPMVTIPARHVVAHPTRRVPLAPRITPH